jgi:hypothetical protein
MAVKSAATATPARTIEAVDARRPEVTPTRYVKRHRTDRAGEGGEREDLIEVGPSPHNDDGGPEARAGGHPEEVGVGQRIAEDSLIGRAAARQHGADQPGGRRRVAGSARSHPSRSATCASGSGSTGGVRAAPRRRSAARCRRAHRDPEHHRTDKSGERHQNGAPRRHAG